MSTRYGRRGRELEDFCTEAKNYETLFASLFKSAFAFSNLDYESGITDLYIMDILFEYGSIAHDLKRDLWLPYTVDGDDLDAYGQPKRVRLFSKNSGGVNFARARKDVQLFGLNAEEVPLADFIRLRCALLADFDNAIKQNLDAIKAMSIIESDDAQNEQLVKTLVEADRQRRLGGRSVAIVETGRGGKLSVLTTGADYMIDRLQEAKRREYEDLLHVCGVRTMLEKGERMITTEVAAQNSEVDAYVGNFVETWNKQAEQQGCDVRVTFTRLREDDVVTASEGGDIEEALAEYGI